MSMRIGALLSVVLVTTTLADATAKCLSPEKYPSLPAKWIAVNPKQEPTSERVWPPPRQYVLFYFAPGRGGSSNEFESFRVGYVHSTGCGLSNTGQGIRMLTPTYQPSVYEPTHWMPLTFVPK